MARNEAAGHAPVRRQARARLSRWRRPTSKLLVSLGLAAVIVCAGVASGLLRSGSKAGASLGSAGRSIFPLRTEVDFDTGEDSPQPSIVEGTGTVLFGRYVVTVAHAVSLDRLEMKVRSARGEVTLPIEGRPVGEKTWLLAGNLQVPLTPLARDAKADLALFLLPRGTDLPSFPYPIGDSGRLDLGDPIAVLGTDPLAGVLLRPGSVVALRGTGLVATVSDSERVFLISLALTSGESGAPIVARRQEGYDLVGLAQGTYIGPRQLAWAIRIGPALEALARQSRSAEVRQFLRLCHLAQVATAAEPRHGSIVSGAPPARVVASSLRARRPSGRSARR